MLNSFLNSQQIDDHPNWKFSLCFHQLFGLAISSRYLGGQLHIDILRHSNFWHSCHVDRDKTYQYLISNIFQDSYFHVQLLFLAWSSPEIHFSIVVIFFTILVAFSYRCFGCLKKKSMYLHRSFLSITIFFFFIFHLIVKKIKAQNNVSHPLFGNNPPLQNSFAKRFQ